LPHWVGREAGSLAVSAALNPSTVNRLPESDSWPTVLGLLLASQPALKGFIDKLLQRDAPLVGRLSALDQAGA
jgi:hypothetical protein